jgi:hypothetical protein
MEDIYSTKRTENCMCNDAKKQLFVFEHDAGRFELLVRILYWILIGIVMWVYGIIAGICLIIQWVHILIIGSRNEALSNVAKGYLEYMVHVMGYVYIMTDKRPDILPVPVGIFEEELPKNS